MNFFHVDDEIDWVLLRIPWTGWGKK